ncbi:MAG: hypothetical protein IKN24_02585 [Lachnospiraceae bacterium]|nr:hypothetical protein [Lachnospiraceae bacterium]
MAGRREREIRKYRITTGIIVGLTLTLLLVLLAVSNSYRIKQFFKGFAAKEEPETTAAEVPSTESFEEIRARSVIEQARLIADGYDYQAAIEYLKSDEGYRNDLTMLEAAEALENEAKTMVKYEDVRGIPHVYVNSLIANTTKAATGSYKALANNSAYLTTAEFTAFLEQLYINDYVLVSIHDMAYWSEEKGKFVTGSIMLPKGKKPIVLSQENMCYSKEKSANGCATRLIIDAYGNINCEMEVGGETRTGAFDMIPILEDFIARHPSFSYRGARAVLGISGGDSLFGYDILYSADAAANKKTAAMIANKLSELGYEFAFNGYVYEAKLCSMEYDEFVNTCENWKRDIAAVVGDTDIVMFPNREDIGDWRYYSGDRYSYLKKAGYGYFINSNDAEKAWNQIIDGYVRQGRRLVSAGTLYSTYSGSDYLSDLCDAAAVLDKNVRDL